MPVVPWSRGWEQFCLSSCTSPVLLPVTPARHWGCLGAAVGTVIDMCCWRAAWGQTLPCCVLLKFLRACRWQDRPYPHLWKRDGCSKMFSRDFGWFWKDEGFVAQPLWHAKRHAADPSEGRCPAPSEAQSCHVLGAQPRASIGIFQICRVGYLEGNVNIQTPRESHIQLLLTKFDRFSWQGDNGAFWASSFFFNSLDLAGIPWRLNQASLNSISFHLWLALLGSFHDELTNIIH